MMKPKAYSYIRMSTTEQLKGDSLRRQRARAEEFCLANHLEIDTSIKLTDIGFSAYKGDHIESGDLGRFLALVGEGKIEPGSWLIIESHDRLSRMQVTKGLRIFLDLLEKGINIAVLSENKIFRAGTTSEMDIMQALFGLARSHDESARKSDRLKQSWEHKRQSTASRILTSICPGWLTPKHDKTGFEVIPERVEAVRSMFQMADEWGLGSFSIARRLNQSAVPPFGRSRDGWHKSSVQKILSNPAVVGRFVPGIVQHGKRSPSTTIIEQYFPPIVDESVYHRVNLQRMQRNKEGGGRRGAGTPNLFSKIARCGYCGGAMHFLNKGKADEVYLVCGRGLRGAGCSRKYWSYREFEQLALSSIKELDLPSLLGDLRHGEEIASMRKTLDVQKLKLHHASIRRERLLALLTGEELTDHLRSHYRQTDAEVAELENSMKMTEHKLALVLQENGSSSQAAETIQNLLREEATSGETARVRPILQAALKKAVTSIHLYAFGPCPSSDNLEQKAA